MWKGLGNLKSGLGDLTTKTLSQVAKAGNRAKEIIAQVDNDDFFEREFGNAEAANPLNNPVSKPELKLKKKKTDEKEETANTEEVENLDISPIKIDNALPKVFSMKNKKETTSSLSALDKKEKDKNSQDENKAKSTLENREASPVEEQRIEPGNKIEEVLDLVQDSGWGVDEPLIIENTPVEEIHKKEETNGENLTEMEKEEFVEMIVEENSHLQKEKHELKSLSDTFEHKVNALDKNLTEQLIKNTKLEEQVAQLSKELAEARRSTTVADIHTEFSEDRKQAMNKYIRECMEQYEKEITTKLMVELNQDLLQQITRDEEGVSEEAQELLQAWTVQPETVREIIKEIVPEEKIIQPFYDESLLQEEIKCQKDENHRLRVKGEEYENRIRELEKQMEEEKAVLARYKKETDETLKKYVEDFVKFEQNKENMEEELNEYKAVLKTRNEDIQRLEQAGVEKGARIEELEENLKKEIALKEDINQQYEGLVAGMKDFDEAMKNLNTENESLSGQFESLNKQIEAEKKKWKDNEHTISVQVKNGLLEKLRRLNSFNADLDIEKAIDSKLVYKEGRVSGDALAGSLETAIALAVEMGNKKFQRQLQEERDIERERYTTLSKNFDKIQGELKESTKKEKELIKKHEELAEMVESMNSSAGQHINKITNLQKSVDELKEAKRKYLEDIGAKNEEIEQLKIKINSFQEESAELNSYVAKLESEATAIPELTSKLEKQAFEVQQLSQIIDEKSQENENLNMTIQNLQSVIDENQQIQENLSTQYNSEIVKLRNDLEHSTRKSQILQEYKEKFETVEKDLEEKKTKIKELTMKLKESEQERNAVKAETAALIKKVKSDTIYKENLVDKRVITNFLIKYFDFNATFAVKLGILETMSSILGFSDDERAKVGLAKSVPQPVEEKVVKKPEEIKTEQPKEAQPGSEEEKSGAEGGQGPSESGEAEKPKKSLQQLFMGFLKGTDE